MRWHTINVVVEKRGILRSGCSKCRVNPCLNQVPDLPITFKDFLIAAGCQVGIGKSVVDRLFCSGYNRADGVGVVAQGYCKIKGCPLNSSRVFERWCEMSIPISCITVIARVLTTA